MLPIYQFVKKNLDFQGKLPDKWKDEVVPDPEPEEPAGPLYYGFWRNNNGFTYYYMKADAVYEGTTVYYSTKGAGTKATSSAELTQKGGTFSAASNYPFPDTVYVKSTASATKSYMHSLDHNLDLYE